jgi:hypothetical protein
VSVPRRSLQALVTALFLVVALALLAPPGAARAAGPLQGVYEGCNAPVLQTTCVDRLQHIKDLGFNVVLNYTALSAHPEDIQAYMRAAERIGVKLIWSFKEPYWWTSEPAGQSLGQLAAACRCATDEELLQYVVGLVKDSPATWGYYVGDETPVAQAGAQAQFSARLHELDPRHPRLFVGIGDGNGVKADIAPFADSAEVLGADFYPVGQNRPLSLVRDVSQRMSDYARSAGKQSAMVLQAFSWSAYGSPGFAPDPTWPSRQQMRQMRDYAVAGGADDLILWFNYYKMAQQPNAGQLFADLGWAANGGDEPALPEAAAGVAPTVAAPPSPAVSGSASAPAKAFVALHAVPQIEVQATGPVPSGKTGLKFARVRCTSRCALTLRFSVGGTRQAVAARALPAQKLTLTRSRTGDVVIRGTRRAIAQLRSVTTRVRVRVVARIAGRAAHASFSVGADGSQRPR